MLLVVVSLKKSFCDSKKHLEEINADGFKVHKVFDGYLYDDLELELTNVKTEEESTDLIHYSPDFKRWIQGISVCVEAMGHNYSPDCVLYISDINNYEGFNYKNSNIWDNYRKNIYKFFYHVSTDSKKLYDTRAEVCKKMTENFTLESMLKVLNSHDNPYTKKLLYKQYPTQSWAETLELMKKSKAEIKNTLVKKDGSPVTDEDISFLNFNNEKVDNLPDTVDYTPIDADMGPFHFCRCL